MRQAQVLLARRGKRNLARFIQSSDAAYLGSEGVAQREAP